MTIDRAKNLILEFKPDMISRKWDPNRLDFPLKCYRCDFQPVSKSDYNQHCWEKHRGKAGYPNKASIKKYSLQPQGMDWEG